MSHAAILPSIIQGGMGVGVSNWTLARAVSSCGQLGVVSGTALDSLFVRRLQDGDIGGHLRRAMERFPIPGVAEAVLEKYFRPEGREEGEAYDLVPMYRQVVTRARHQLTALANFVEVYLAREGHDGVVGINLLTKVQMPNLASLYGAMLAGVDYVLMGAGIPREIPGVLDRLAQHEPVEMSLDVLGLPKGERAMLTMDPADVSEIALPELKRPAFLPIVASNALATTLARKATGEVNGFIIEGPTAGGHNAPPRGPKQLNERGEPVYGERDEVDLEKIRDLGLPFWVAGGAGHPERLREAKEAGAAGVQVGTLFAYCNESGLTPDHKEAVLKASLNGGLDVVTEDRASPTGFPFKAIQIQGTLSTEPVYQKRQRVCDLGYLRTAYRRDDGRLDYRCPAEPVKTFVKKGGDETETAGRKCLCNALMANIGHGQDRGDGVVEPELYTGGDDVKIISRFLDGRTSYSAADVIEYLLGEA